MNQWQDSLQDYGACLSVDARIERKGKTLDVRVREVKGRLRFESGAGALLASGPATPATIERFVERFWFWTKEAV